MKNKNIMVCVTQQKTCERLILSGYEMLKTDNDKLFVIHVVNEKDNFLNNNSDGEALEYLFNVSKKVGANLTVLRSKDVVKTIEDFAVKNKITHILMGASPDADGGGSQNLTFKLNKMLPEVEFVIL
ncbi:universal stress protein [Sporanaerobacter acetigenes]|uniref:Universal stress protein family protein n=1 Tax=Sporanaerobacter acetigenes DSM 13106 TaxID=1123281 RepID=A0A1M5UTQ0_9FIRM|nr:universal stress protein [Sporanaerobacter acetigenes]SHH66351.1 Universal stress protein family protein [Sporanaerobacter acetigenes DSM 13106]